MQLKNYDYSLLRGVILSLYITACYLALIGGDEVTRMAAYRRITRDDSRLKSLVERKVVNLMEVNKGLSDSYMMIKCGAVDISSRPPFIALIIIPGLFVFILIFVLTRCVANSTLRGFLILSSFVIVCFISNSLQRHLLGFLVYR
jgi:hypothetical protein